MKNLKSLAVLLICVPAMFASAQTGPSGAVKKDVEKLVQDIKLDAANSSVTPQQIQQLKTDLLAATANAHKPDPAAVTALKSTLLAIKQSGTITNAQKALVAKEIADVLTSAGVSVAAAQAVMNDLIAIWNATNLTQTQLMQLAMDVRTLIADLPSLPNN